MVQNTDKAIARLRLFVLLACILSGILAGGNVYRYVIEVPAWRHLSIVSWGEYSRYADLGNGLVLFPAEAIGSFILLMISSVMVFKNRGVFKFVSLSIYSATVFALAGLVFTFFAAPIMLSIHTLGNDPEKLQQAFDSFHFWGRLRAGAQILSFCSCVWAMGKVSDITIYKE